MDARARALYGALWSQAEALAAADRNSEIYSLFASSLNEVLKVHNARIVLGAQHRIPLLIWVVMFVVTVIFDLDQPGKGLIDVSQRPMYELRDRITGAAAPEAR